MKRIYYILIVCIMSVFMLSCGKKQDVNIPDKQEEKVQQEEKKERKLQKAVIDIKNKYGKNIILKAMSLEEGATMKERNMQVGGHKG